MEEAITHSYLENTGKYKGIFAWLTSTDHKRIGLMYMYAMMVFFLVGVAGWTYRHRRVNKSRGL